MNDGIYSSSSCNEAIFAPAGYHFVSNIIKEFSRWGNVETAVNSFLADGKTGTRMMTIGSIAMSQSSCLVVINIWEKDDV